MSRIHYYYPVGKGKCLFLVMGNDYSRKTEMTLYPLYFHLHFSFSCASRLLKARSKRSTSGSITSRPCKGSSAAVRPELSGITRCLSYKLYKLQYILYFFLYFIFGQFFQLQAESYVVENRHMGKQRIVLEKIPTFLLYAGIFVHYVSVYSTVPSLRSDGYHTQYGSFSAAAAAQKGNHFALLK